MGEYKLILTCSSDTVEPVADLMVIIKNIAPYMVDNVELEPAIATDRAALHGQPYEGDS